MGEFIVSKAIKFQSLGDPRETLSLTTEKVKTSLDEREVLIRWIASPVNPADINIARGVYFYKRLPPASLGIDGFGIVEKVGQNVSYVKPGDHVMPLHPHIQGGYWREYQVLLDDGIYRLDKRLPLEAKGTLTANAATAYLMLKEYVKLTEGDYVLQNAANSQVGRAVIEICKAFGYKSINVIRDRKDVDDLKQELKSLGGDFVFTESEFKSIGRDLIKNLDRPLKLSINGVGGRSSIPISANLTKFGTMIVYGGMSLKPHEVLTSSLVFNSIKIIGFQLFDWFGVDQSDFRKATYDELTKLFLANKLHPSPMEKVPMEGFKEAVAKTMAGSNLKQLLMISKDYYSQI
ncbi:unnamed protein product [Bursaphelenchus okinawaensis]|uniref:Enoyl-[acyl-carrier-protein] reductase, mitochondrial n=1 Tax=Bursaphelenchus okinawaensis TaxID=465554 RepID=A0A811KUQ9_9BILA|nr:unnamed protein product [Bursaphelenchus okinawaensis]CAG9112440.1 unnamed protein product [Bursaphelenchus okinawaensis]